MLRGGGGCFREKFGVHSEYGHTGELIDSSNSGCCATRTRYFIIEKNMLEKFSIYHNTDAQPFLLTEKNDEEIVLPVLYRNILLSI